MRRKRIIKTDGDPVLNLFPEDTPLQSGQLQALPECSFDHTLLFERLSQSKFRSKFHLSSEDIDYIHEKGIDIIRRHAIEFITHRLSPADIPNDGKQTPMHGHPVFLAQHATACCCRGCLCKWHHIPPGRALTHKEEAYIISVLMTWIHRQLDNH